MRALIPFGAAFVLAVGLAVSAPRDVPAATSTACASATLAASPPPPARPGTAVTLTASASGCASPQYRFWLLPPGGAWTQVQAYGSDATYSWDTTTAAQGVWGLEVWTRNGTDTAAYEAYAVSSYQVTNACTSVTATGSPASPQAPGAAITFTASAATCASPQYEFWMQPPGGSWHQAQAYGSQATYSWNTTGAATGGYNFQVRARNAGSSAVYEAYQTFPYTLPACQSVALSASPTSPRTPGTAVSVSAAAAGCAAPQYRFWLRPPGGAWTQVQDYGSASAYSWSTQGAAPGAWTVEVWARNGAGGAAYDTYAAITYVLSSACAGVTLTAAPQSPQPPGTAVTLSAATSNCPNPQFEYWLQAPGGPWQVAQAYGAGATLAWDTSGLATGTYNVQVRAREAGSTVAYDAYQNSSYALPACTSAGLTANLASPQQVGAVITLTATAAGCGSPQYRFWLQPPGGAWKLVQDYGSSATYSWNTSGGATGAWRLEVWARDGDTSSAYDAYTQAMFAITGCTGATLGSSVASPQPPGTVVALTAAAAGCSNPVYEFWVRPPRGSWQSVQAYGSGTGYSWNTSGLGAGTYVLEVWARSPLSGSAYDTYATLMFWVKPSSWTIPDVPYYSQVYSLSCEEAALEMALGHEGISVSQSQVLSYIGVDWRSAYYDSSGRLHWGDPYTSFVGNPNGSEINLTGYGTFYPMIAGAASGFGGTVVRNGEGVSPQSVYDAVLNDEPVVAWVAFDWRYHYPGSWIAFDGNLIPYAGPVEHAVTIAGVTPDSVLVYNPDGGPQWVDKATFEAAYATYDDMAVILN